MDSESYFRQEEKDSIIAALACFKGDDADRARAAFRHISPEGMQVPNADGQSRNTILAHYEAREAEIDRLITKIQKMS